MRKHDLIKESLIKHTANKENILNNILTIVREEERIEATNRRNSVLILELLQRKQMYGYEISKELEFKSNGAFTFNEGDLYPFLHDLELNGLLKSYWLDYSEDNENSRKYYEITAKGKNQLVEEQQYLNKLNIFNNTTLEVLSWK